MSWTFKLLFCAQNWISASQQKEFNIVLKILFCDLDIVLEFFFYKVLFGVIVSSAVFEFYTAFLIRVFLVCLLENILYVFCDVAPDMTWWQGESWVVCVLGLPSPGIPRPTLSLGVSCISLGVSVENRFKIQVICASFSGVYRQSKIVQNLYFYAWKL